MNSRSQLLFSCAGCVWLARAATAAAQFIHPQAQAPAGEALTRLNERWETVDLLQEAICAAVIFVAFRSP
jgi:hypothetical protein